MKLAILDMGNTQYGDCLLLQNNGATILIDGGHSSDYEGQSGFKSIPNQLASLMAGPPFQVDLLVVTHSHLDHIGCLPKLVKNNELKATYALVSDPDHRWGTPSGTLPDARTAIDRAVSLLGEEVPPIDSFGSRDELRAYLDAAVNQETEYRKMIADLKAAGTVVKRYGTDTIPTAMKNIIKKAGLTLLGPTTAHLQICAQRLAEHQSDARDALLRDSKALDAAAGDYVELYSRLRQPGSLTDAAWHADAADSSQGAINNLSIVFALKLGSSKILLPGDMQFAKPQTGGLESAMSTLLTKIVNAGPYAAIKTAHHTSDNGWNKDLHLNRLPVKWLFHSGGRHDDGHPDADTLKMLEENSTGRKFYRTDRNGLIQIELEGTSLKVTTAKSGVNNFQPNPKPDFAALSAEAEPAGAAITSVSTGGKPGDVVRVHAEIPNRRTRVVITVDIDPAGGSNVSVSPATDLKKN
jgi:beta-lactamase superfamily II metal-dependent hydrolase